MAIKLLEDDNNVIGQIQNTNNGKEIIKHVRSLRKALEKNLGLILILVLFQKGRFIEDLTEQFVTESKKDIVSPTDKIDKIVTHKILGIPILLAIMWLVFTFTFSFSAPL